MRSDQWTPTRAQRRAVTDSCALLGNPEGRGARRISGFVQLNGPAGANRASSVPRFIQVDVRLARLSVKPLAPPWRATLRVLGVDRRLQGAYASRFPLAALKQVGHAAL